MRKYIHVSHFLALLSLLGVILYAIGGTLQYYFYSDDYSILYFIQRNKFPGWPYDETYRFIYKPLYAMFELHPFGYFALGVGTYFLATLSVYALTRVITKRPDIAYLSSLIFATGYIGVDQYTMMIVSSGNNLTIVLIAAALMAYLFWIEHQRLGYYIASICIFALSLKFVPYRAYSLILFIPTVELLYTFMVGPWRGIVKKLGFSILRLLPFYVIGKYFGIFGYGNVGTFSVEKIIAYTSPAMLEEFIAILGRMMLPSPILVQLGFTVSTRTHAAAGILMSLLVVTLTFLLRHRKANRKIGLYLMLFLALTIEGYAGYFLLLPSFSSSGAVNRYLPIAFIGYSALFPLIFWALGVILYIQRNSWYRAVTTLVIVGFITVLATASRRYVSAHVKEQGLPASKFFPQFKSYIPVMPQHLSLYMDYPNYYPAIPRLGKILSNAMFPYEVTFAVQYNVPIDHVSFTLSFDEYVKRLTHPTPGEKFHSFYYDGNNLRDTTNDILQSLQSDKTTIVARNIPATVVPNDKKIVTVDMQGASSFGKQQLELTMKLTPLDGNQFAYPYFVGSPSAILKKEIRDFFDHRQIDRSAMFSYFTARKQYYNTVQATGTESHQDYPYKFMIDNRLDTYWVDAEHLWQLKAKYKQSFVIDLGMVKKVSRIVWIPVSGREPSVYKISLSADNMNWQRVDARSTRVPTGDSFLVTDAFDPAWLRYIRYEIDDTRNGQTPGMRELEVVEEAYRDIDPILAWRIGNAPFEYIKNQEELREAYAYVANHGVLRILTKTNKEDVLANQYFVSLPVFVDGQTHTYTVPIPSRGTTLETLGIEAAYPMEVRVEQMRVVRQKMVSPEGDRVGL